jgi:hypothetical protein
MTSSSAIINKAFRRHLCPVIRAAGFEKVDARNGWAWKTDCVWVLMVRAVGNYFSEVTGWPPASVGVSLGVYYSFIPSRQPFKADKKGRSLPTEYQCHMRSRLESRLPQDDRVSVLPNPAERGRKDLWWLDPSGASADSTRNCCCIPQCRCSVVYEMHRPGPGPESHRSRARLLQQIRPGNVCCR